MEYTTEQLENVQRINSCKNYYQVLNVSQQATVEEIQKSYKKLAKSVHPDKNRAPGAKEAFQNIANAERILSDKSSRHKYDEQMKPKGAIQPKKRTFFLSFILPIIAVTVGGIAYFVGERLFSKTKRIKYNE